MPPAIDKALAYALVALIGLALVHAAPKLKELHRKKYDEEFNKDPTHRMQSDLFEFLLTGRSLMAYIEFLDIAGWLVFIIGFAQLGNVFLTMNQN